MGKPKQKQKKGKGILAGHKQVGKHVLPPMEQLIRKSSAKSTRTSYVDSILPELVWIGLINEHVGYSHGKTLVEKVFLAVGNTKKDNQTGNYALMSNFNKLDDTQKSEIVNILKKEDVLEAIQNSIAPLVLLYDNCPLFFMGPPTNIYSKESLVLAIKKCVAKVINRDETPAIVLYSAMFMFSVLTKNIRISPDVKLPNFDSIASSPDSEEAIEAILHIRAFGLIQYNISNISNSWAKHFWDRNYELSPCEFQQH